MKWLARRGFNDSLSVYDTGSKTWTWPIFYLFDLNGRYDHIMISEKLHCTGAKVTEIVASDHMPVLAVVVQKF